MKDRKENKAIPLNSSVYGKIAASDRFQHFTLSVIVDNALWIGVDTEWNHKYLKDAQENFPLDPYAMIVENIFCVYFTAEVVIRFLAYKRKCDCFRDAWFVFDSLLVSCMVLETWIIAIITAATGGSGGASFLSNFSALRLLRLLRLTRMARLMRSVPELMTLVKGMMSAIKSVFFILVFLVLVMYVFAIIFTSTVGNADNNDPEPETAEHMFGSMFDCMMTLFTNGVLGDNLSATVQAILDYPDGKGSYTGNFLLWLFLLFFAISSMTLLNMLIGVLCEVITSTAGDEKETMQIRDLQICIEDAFNLIDTNLDGRVCEAEWSQIKESKFVRAQLGSLGGEATHMDERLHQMQQTLIPKPRCGCKTSTPIQFGTVPSNSAGSSIDREEGLSLDDLISKVIDIRPDKPATALDLEILRAKVSIRDKQFQGRLGNVEHLIGKMLGGHGVPMAGKAQASALEASLGPSSPLKEIPTQLLFQEMKCRAQKATPQKAMPGPGSNLLPSQGAVSYSAIKNLCSDLGN